MNKEQIKRIVEIVKTTPGISLFDIDRKLEGLILGTGQITGITEDEFDCQLVGVGKPLTKTNGGYYA